MGLDEWKARQRAQREQEEAEKARREREEAERAQKALEQEAKTRARERAILEAAEASVRAAVASATPDPRPPTPPTADDALLAKQMNRSPMLRQIGAFVEITPYKAKFPRARGSAPLVAALTGDGEEMILRAWQMSRGELVTAIEQADGSILYVPVEVSAKDIAWALEFLANRLWGKSPDTLHVKAESAGPTFDYSRLSVQELLTLRALTAKAESDQPQVVEGEVVEDDPA